MTGPPAPRPSPDTVSRGSREKQPRAFGEAGRVRVVSEDDFLIDVCPQNRLGRYLAAPNAEVKRRPDGSIRLVRLRSLGDDRGHLGENHGRSTVTTERVRNDWGVLVGGNFNLDHKATSASWGAPAVTPVPNTAEARKALSTENRPQPARNPQDS
jgi:hypothetical protein